jgi:myo-inositol 2-dehydrogenase/D-chiro-inositol 1-dehydrogenase
MNNDTGRSNHDSGARLGRRRFLAATAGAAGVMILPARLVRGTAANSAVRVGLLGCGGRGTEDATHMLDTGLARITALADLFPDQLAKAKQRFNSLAQQKGYAGVDDQQLFLGPTAFQQIAHSNEVDAIIIATPPYFHPEHLEAVVAAGKHVYCEKPVAVDPDGAQRVIACGQKAAGRLSLDVGFQIRNAPPFVELVKRIHGGALGTIVCGEAYYYGTYLNRPAWPNASPNERRLRNWVWDRVLSGDIIVEQNIHALDICNWVLQGHPLKASGVCGRKVRPDPGDASDHYNVVFTYPEGVHVTLNSTQFDRGWWDVNERFFGSKGVSESHYSGPCAIYGDEPWSWNTANSPQKPESKEFSATGSFSDNLAQADPEKKKAFLESILSGQFHNQAAQGAESALTAMLGRTAAYQGREVTWDEVANSHEKWESNLDLNHL